MKTRKLTDNELNLLNENEQFRIASYMKQTRKIILIPPGERYKKIKELCNKIEKEQSDWLEYDDATDMSLLMWYSESYLGLGEGFDEPCKYIDSDTFKKKYKNNEPLIDYNGIKITKSEDIMFDIYCDLRYELLREGELLRSQGDNSIPPITPMNELSPELQENIIECIKTVKKSLKKKKRKKTKLTTADLKLIAQFNQYNDLAKKIIKTSSAKDRVVQLENLIGMMDSERPDHHCLECDKFDKGECGYMFVTWHEIDKEGNSIEKRDYIDYEKFRSMLLNYQHILTISDEDPSYILLEVAKFGLANLYTVLVLELVKSRKEAMVYGEIEIPKSDNKKIIEAYSSSDHYSMSVSDTVLKDILFDLKKYGWVAKETKDDDWIFRLTGRVPQNGKSPTEPIVFTGLNKCYYIVKNFIFKNYKKISGDDWDKAKTIFSVPGCNIDGLPNASKKPSGSNFIDDAIKNVKN